MEAPPLDPAELDAIRDAIADSPSAPRSSVADIDPDDVEPLCLIADDRAAVSARPTGRAIGERWAERIALRLRHMAAGELEVSVIASDAVEGPTLRDELRAMWTRPVNPVDRSGSAIVAVGGTMIEEFAARLLGSEDADGSSGTERKPSQTALRLFGPIGGTIADALCRAWRDEQGADAKCVEDAAAAAAATSAVTDGEVVICVRIRVSGDVTGHVLCLARPETLVAPPAPVDAVPASTAALDEALGSVPVDVRVDLGRTTISAREFAKLRVGSVLPLAHFTDDPLPIECAGVVKAHGRAVVHRGVLSVEVLTSVPGKRAA